VKVKVAIGDVEVTMHGVDLTPRQISAFITRCASVALAMQQTTEAETARAVGFTAHLDLDPERNLAEDTSEWFEESP